MLSKVLNRLEPDRIQPAVFAYAVPKPIQPAEKEQASQDELRGLRARLQQVEGEAAAARREAFEAGRQQGEQKARTEIAAVLDRVNASLAELTGLRHELRLRSEKDVVRLALLIGKRVLHRELSVDTGALTALARVVFERLARAESYRVTVHPQFAAPIRSAISGHMSSRIEVEGDPNCPLGAFTVRSEEGSIDASVDSQLDEIGRGLADRLGASAKI